MGFLYPVILNLPKAVVRLKGRSRVAALGCYARQSLRLSGEAAGFYPETLDKGVSGQPLPSNGVYWSISHKPGSVAGVVSRGEIGIDIETLTHVSDGLYHRVLKQSERELFSDHDRLTAFFRCFTAKEALLKRYGIGFAGFSKVTVVALPDASTAVLEYQKKMSIVEQIEVYGHMASLVKDGNQVVWDYIDLSLEPAFEE